MYGVALSSVITLCRDSVSGTSMPSQRASSRDHMFCALTTRPALMLPCVVSTPVTRAPSRRRPVTRHAFAQRRARLARRARIGGEREVRVGVAGGRLPADDRVVAEVEQRMDALRFVGRDFTRVDPGAALNGERGAQRVGALAFGSEQHQSAAR